MRNATLYCALLLITVAPVRAQPKIDTRKVAALEKKVSQLQTTFDERNTELRKVYRDLEKKLDEAAQADGGARLQADIVRVLEPLLKDVRAQAAKAGSANAAKARQKLKSGVKKALAKLEIDPLSQMRDYLETRFFDMVAQAGKVKDALSLSDDDIARHLLKHALDQTIPFYERWNAGLSASAKGTEDFRKIHKELSAAKIDLAIAKDPLLEFQIGCDPGFARVPPGPYVLMTTAGFITGPRKKTRKFNIDKEVWIGLYEVTNEQYLAWIETLSEDQRQKHLPKDASGKLLWALDTESGRNLPDKTKLKHPVVGINLESACLYAASLGCRLPTENEWFAMAAGKKARPYPWGDQWEPDRCNDREAALDDTSPVGKFENGRGPFGHYDVAGNVAEWLLTYENAKNIDPTNIASDANAVVRGGSYRDGKKDVSTGWVWLKRAKFDRDTTTGFRIAKIPPMK